MSLENILNERNNTQKATLHDSFYMKFPVLEKFIYKNPLVVAIFCGQGLTAYKVWDSFWDGENVLTLCIQFI